jgi:hypothetical protein
MEGNLTVIKPFSVSERSILLLMAQCSCGLQKEKQKGLLLMNNFFSLWKTMK